jgi:hypothetical protein
MDLELKQLGQTLAVGAFALLGFWLIFRIFKPDFLKNFLNENKEQFENLSFVMNSKHVVADRNPPVKCIREVFSKCLISDKEARYDLLFNEEGNLDKFGDRLNRAEYFEFIDSHQYRQIRGFLPPHASLSITESDCLKKIVNEIYYDAKDRVFQETNYFQELTVISTRMEFLRAFVFVLELMLILVTCTLVVSPLVYFILPKPDEKVKNRLISLFGFFMLCVCLVFVIPSAYEEECSNFNRRVFGYHLSLIKKRCSENCVKNSEIIPQKPVQLPKKKKKNK